jgi:dTDP-4-dehydrorhamnose 3,5-epimerase
MPLEFLATPLDGLRLVQRQTVSDTRGFFCRVFDAEEFAAAGVAGSVSQINHTLTRRRGAVRGLHFQYPPHAECKLVSCIRGSVFDVAVDLRRDSPSFLRWHAEMLTAENSRSLLIPEGFAHGFQALEADCELIYVHTAAYRADAEGGLSPADPRLAIDWPLDVIDLSQRDRSHALIGPDWKGIEL